MLELYFFWAGKVVQMKKIPTDCSHSLITVDMTDLMEGNTYKWKMEMERIVREGSKKC